MDRTKRWKTAALCVGGLAVFIQVIRPTLDNPSLSAEPKWDSPRTRELARRACFDCHSNQTRYPWYFQVEPVRWFLWDHVQEGREHLNFSEPDSDLDVDDLVDAIRSDEMPIAGYRLLHPEARLTAQEKDSLVVGLLRTFEDIPDSAEDSDSSKTSKGAALVGEREEKEDRD